MLLPAAGFAQTSGRNQYGGVAGEMTTPPDRGAVAGESASGGGIGPQREEAESTAGGELPFTGGQLLAIVLAGGLLVGLGSALRVTARRV